MLHPGAHLSLQSGGGRHAVLLARAADLAAPSTVKLPAATPPPGLILPDGTINWGCPCLGGMATGPCGTHFRIAFSCFHYSDAVCCTQCDGPAWFDSEADPKGSDCYEKFSEMQSCMSRFPELYARDDDDDDMPAATAPPAPPARPAQP